MSKVWNERGITIKPLIMNEALTYSYIPVAVGRSDESKPRDQCGDVESRNAPGVSTCPKRRCVNIEGFGR